MQKIVGGLPPEPKEVCILASDVMTTIFQYTCRHVGRKAVEVYSKSLVKLQTIQRAGMDIQHKGMLLGGVLLVQEANMLHQYLEKCW